MSLKTCKCGLILLLSVAFLASTSYQIRAQEIIEVEVTYVDVEKDGIAEYTTGYLVPKKKLIKGLRLKTCTYIVLINAELIVRRIGCKNPTIFKSTDNKPVPIHIQKGQVNKDGGLPGGFYEFSNGISRTLDGPGCTGIGHCGKNCTQASGVPISDYVITDYLCIQDEDAQTTSFFNHPYSEGDLGTRASVGSDTTTINIVGPGEALRYDNNGDKTIPHVGLFTEPFGICTRVWPAGETQFSVRVLNPDDEYHYINIDVSLENWDGWNAYSNTSEMSLPPGEDSVITVFVETPSSPLGEVNIVYIAASTLSGDSAEIGHFVEIGPGAPVVTIEKVHDALQGMYQGVSITLGNSEVEMGGFDFLIAYDASALTFMEATPGQLLEDCGWEYFTYRHGVQGNCGDACPSGLLRIVAMAETNDGPNHPSCFGPPDTDPHELAKMKFFVTDDRTFECQFTPIYFFWDDCGDNMISSIEGDPVYIDRAIYGFDGYLIWDEEDDDEFPEDARIPFVGAPDFCLNPDPEKPTAIRYIDFINGGIDIVCGDSIDLKCDLNLDNIPYTVADAVMYINYFIYGPSSLGLYYPAVVAASDCNGDGRVLTVADLVYLIRVILGLAPPDPKVIPATQTAAVNLMVNHSAAAISVNSPVDMGAAQFVIEYSGYEICEPHLINGASDMTLKYSDQDGILRVLVYSMEKDTRISAGEENIFVVPINGEGEMTINEVQLSDYDGNVLNSTIAKETVLPTRFVLHQNYPNPFNATTQIVYELPHRSHIKIEIYNVRGQKVAELFDGEESAGIHRVEWDGTDDYGNDVASGVYFYRLTADDYKSEKKMVLMK